MTSGWIVAAEIGIVAAVCLGWAYSELKSLKRLREERERKAREEKSGS